MPVLSRGLTTVDYLVEGAGPAVVLVHSSVSGNRQWKRLIETCVTATSVMHRTCPDMG
jgi:hypothetical protein